MPSLIYWKRVLSTYPYVDSNDFFACMNYCSFQKYIWKVFLHCAKILIKFQIKTKFRNPLDQLTSLEWTFKNDFLANFFSHPGCGHSIVFPVWRAMCVFNIVFCVNDFSQTWHLYGFKVEIKTNCYTAIFSKILLYFTFVLVWILLWQVSALPWANEASHPGNLHLYGFMPEIRGFFEFPIRRDL